MRNWIHEHLVKWTRAANGRVHIDVPALVEKVRATFKRTSWWNLDRAAEAWQPPLPADIPWFLFSYEMAEIYEVAPGLVCQWIGKRYFPTFELPNGRKVIPTEAVLQNLSQWKKRYIFPWPIRKQRCDHGRAKAIEYIRRRLACLRRPEEKLNA